ncbi:hypothetical protein T492DRAFT_1022483 [Pavlovales sp. CCMP2436]|nr:hypothetical protein T492DRAFT_1022483 [Pavlovales sp. CCMP2436]|mmetsp:Transcript_12737/g.29906  ORF Transcript_12737/g.29906 Transcript_12737/m.29906 type:complete len:176 (-) Transcript_12737:114-641(-)
MGPFDGEEGAMRLNRGCVLTALGSPDEALRDFDRALALDKGNKLASLNRALALMDLGREAEAFASLKALVLVAGMAVEPYWLLYGLLLSEEGRADITEATGLLKRVEAKFGFADDVHAALALTLAREGKLNGARAQWRLVKDPAPFRDEEKLARKPRRWPRKAARDLQARLPELE